MTAGVSAPRGVAVVLRGKHVLVIKRRQDGRNYAVLPGGGVEPNESAAEAAVRELYEETTLEADVQRLLWTRRHDGRQASYFLMAPVGGEPLLSGAEAEAHSTKNSYEVVWATQGDFARLGLVPVEIRALVGELLGP